MMLVPHLVIARTNEIKTRPSPSALELCRIVGLPVLFG